MVQLGDLNDQRERESIRQMRAQVWKRAQWKRKPAYVWYDAEGRIARMSVVDAGVLKTLLKSHEHGEYVEDAWDHGHCGICMDPISEENEDGACYVTSDDGLICCSCYSRFISPGGEWAAYENSLSNG